MTGQRHILLVDDDVVTLEVLKTHLEPKGYRVTLADGIAEAIEALKQKDTVDLVVLDYLMPQGFGTDLLQLIGRDTRMQKPRVIMSSSLIEEEDTSWQMLLNRLPSVSQKLICAYVPKPYSLQQMDDALELTFKEQWSGDYGPR